MNTRLILVRYRYLESLHASAKDLEAKHKELSLQIRLARARRRDLEPRPGKEYPTADINNNAHLSEAVLGVSRSSTNETRPKHHEGGLGFLRVILASIQQKDWDGCFHDHHATSKISNGRTKSRERNVPDLASKERVISSQLGAELTEIFLRKAFIKHPFMTRSTIQKTTQAVLTSYSASHTVTDQEHFRAFMIFAIGAVYRNQELRHSGSDLEQSRYIDPYSLYAKALSRGKSFDTFHGLDAVTNLLLVARFGFFCVTGISLWDISFLCLRVAIESGFHKRPTKPLAAIEEQIQRRVFWQCYNLDRHSSTTLGRPFGIPDASITVKLPVNIDDEILESSLESLDAIEMLASSYRITEISIFCALTRLRTICSRMVTDFKRLKRKLERRQQSATTSQGRRDLPNTVFSAFSLPRQIWQLYDAYMKELLHWRKAIPEGLASISSHYNDTRWLDLHLLQEKLLLSRHALDLMALADPSSLIPPTQLTDDFYNAAKDIIILYSELSTEAAIEPAQGRFYRVFIAGLSMLYVIIIQQKRASMKLSGAESIHTSNLSSHPVSTHQGLLRTCRETLSRMAKSLVDQQMAVRYLAVYDVLCREVLKHTSQLLGPASSGLTSTGDSANEELPHHGGRQNRVQTEVDIAPNDCGAQSADSHAAAMALSHLAVDSSSFRAFSTEQSWVNPNVWASQGQPPLNASDINLGASASGLENMTGMFLPINSSSLETDSAPLMGVDPENPLGWTNIPSVNGYSPGIYTGYDQNPGMLLSDWEGIFNVLVNE